VSAAAAAAASAYTLLPPCSCACRDTYVPTIACGKISAAAGKMFLFFSKNKHLQETKNRDAVATLLFFL
jgi:hypothetical protein